LGIAVGVFAGLVVGIAVSVATDLPFAPEVGAVLGGVAGWLLTRAQGTAA
jgi:hypothetical protein